MKLCGIGILLPYLNNALKKHWVQIMTYLKKITWCSNFLCRNCASNGDPRENEEVKNGCSSWANSLNLI